MKKTLLTLCAALFTLGMQAQTTAAAAAAGTYSGVLYVQLMEELTDETQPLPEYDEDGEEVVDADGNTVYATYEVVITKEDDTHVTFGLYNFGFMGMNLGDIILPGVPVELDEDGKVKFGENEAKNFSFLDGAIEATAKINEANSYIDGTDAHVDVDVMWTNAGDENVPIYVRFVGSKPEDTGISQVTSDKGQVTSVYDLQGRKLTKVQAGVNIVNGSKIIK